MSEQWFQVGVGHSDVETERNGSLLENGGGADREAAVGNDTDQDSESDAVTGTAAEVTDERSEFVAELVRAVQTTAGAERARIAEDVEARRQALIDAIHARQALEADQVRALADEDMQAIDAWAEGERQRIELERERRVKELQDDLSTSLAEHSSKIDRQVEAVEASIATYRADVETFFADIDRETDLVLIAQQASRRPILPDLDEIIDGIAASSAPEEEMGGQSAAASDGATETPMIGVMDREATAEPVDRGQAPADPSFGAAAEATPDAEAAPDAIEEPQSSEEAAEPVATVAAPGGTPASLFHSLSVSRPGSWLRRDPSTADGGNHEEWR